MLRRVPSVILPLLQDYVQLISLHIPEVVCGVYLQGSIALGGFIPGRSDIDFITVVSGPLTSEEISRIDLLHEHLKSKHDYYSVMEGQYTTLDHLRKTAPLEREQFPKYFYGENRGLTKGQIDNTALWILKKHGLTLLGPEVNDLDIHVGWPDLLKAMKYNLHTYWTEKAYNYELFLQDNWVDDTVLTLGRIAYTLEHQSVVTKDQGGHYLMQTLPFEWHALIYEAMRIRQGMSENGYFPSIAERAARTQSFIRYMVKVCTEQYHLDK
ncbi:MULTISPECIES: aminoglycoside adenylyltransferase domain-containing protein [unclassified Paenibacillus]|uniref:aminoglycoside adenylyltransferase domain-containing protein n=1 Tax=unclassified Paenibacillus TaxID=185978 RepID=UPI0036262D62